VLCLDAETGKTIWETFVASGHTEINLFGNPTRESAGSAVAVDGDTVFYCTNHGAAAALDRRTGRLLWIVQYLQMPILPSRDTEIHHNPYSWANNPPIATHGLFLSTPTDSQQLYAFDRRTGMIRWNISRKHFAMTYMYGVSGDTLVLGGRELALFSIAGAGKLLSVFSPAPGWGRGRGAVARDAAYLPATTGFYRVPLASMKATVWKPWTRKAQDSGNLVVADGAVVVASPDRIDVYCARRPVGKELLEAVKRNPDDAALRYRVALAHLQAGEGDGALRELGEVVRLAGPSLLGRAAQRRLFSLSISMGRKAVFAGEADVAAAAFELAREIAPDDESKIEVTFRLADARILQERFGEAIGLLQGLLETHPAEISRGLRVDERVRENIAAVLRRAGPGVYAKFEAEAERLLKEARGGGEPEAFLRIVALYPNSRTARRALLDAARAWEAKDRRDDALPLLRRFLRDYPGDALAPEAYVSLIRLLEKKDRLLAASAFLRRVRRLYPDREIEVGGRKTTVKEYADERLARKEYRLASLDAGEPVLPSPVKKVCRYVEADFSSGAPLPVGGRPPAGAAELLLMDYGRTVKALHPEKGEALWKVDLKASCRLAAYFDDGLLLCTERAIYRLDPVAGTVAWTHETDADMRGFGMAGHLVAYRSSDRRRSAGFIAALDATSGEVAWKRSYEGIPTTTVRGSGERFVMATVSPSRIHVFDLETGRRLAEGTPHTAGTSLRFLYLSEDLVVTHSGFRSIEAHTLPGAEFLWRLSLADYTIEAMEIRPEGLFFAATPHDRSGASGPFLARVDLGTGKMVKLREGVGIGTPHSSGADDERAYLVVRDSATRKVSLRAVSLDTLETEWSADLAGMQAAVLPLEMSRDHVVVPFFERGANRKYRYTAAVVDKQGKVVQRLESTFMFERLPSAYVLGRTLMFSVDNIVDVYR
jgi:outer membrane protein assembly factor BamB